MNSEEDVMTTHHRRRTCSLGVALLILGTCLPGRRALAQAVDASPISRIRSEEPSITAVIERGLTHSPTLRRLVAGVEASDGIVYVESGRCPEAVAACLLNWMKSSGGNRFVRIVVDPKRLDSDWRLLVAIGHELQHVLEVLDDRFVTDSRKIFFFYQQYAPTPGTRFETQAAINAGLNIRKELHVWRRPVPSRPPGNARTVVHETGGVEAPVSQSRTDTATGWRGELLAACSCLDQ
jgi:hypothetical protein